MRIKLIFTFEKENLKRMRLITLMNILSYFNNEKTECYFKRHNDESIEVIVTQKENIFRDCGIKHFDNKEEYKKWLEENYGQGD